MKQNEEKCELCEGNEIKYFIDNNGRTLYFCDECLPLDRAQAVLEILGFDDLEVGEYVKEKETKAEDPLMHCIFCNSEDIEIEDGILSCECGEDYRLDDELGFIHYGQGGMESFSFHSYRELSISMAEHGDKYESWHYLFEEQFHLGTGAVEIYPCGSELEGLIEAIAWMKGEIQKRKDREAQEASNRGNKDVKRK